MNQPKDILFATLRHEKTPRAPWVPFAGVHAGKLIGQVAKIAGGGGGGQPNKAQAGGKDASKVAEAISQVEGILKQMPAK